METGDRHPKRAPLPGSWEQEQVVDNPKHYQKGKMRKKVDEVRERVDAKLRGYRGPLDRLLESLKILTSCNLVGVTVEERIKLKTVYEFDL